MASPRVAQKTWTQAALQQLAARAKAADPAYTPPANLQPNLGFKPWEPWSSSPPSGTYDPSLDAAAGAAGRGYQDLQSDVARQGQRDTVDYGLQREGLIKSGMQAEQDRQLGFAREGSDYSRNVAMLQRAFQVKGNVQKQQASSYGVLHGGALLQSASKRAANEALARQPLDTSHARFQTDSAEQQNRINDGTQTSLGRLALLMAPPDAGNPLGGRSFQDRTTQVTRAGRENTQFGIDTEAQKAFQAGGVGWDPGTRPRGEFAGGASGGPERVQVVGGIRYRIDPQGHVISSSRRKRR